MPEKMSDQDMMSEKIMKSGHDAREPETKRRDQIQARYRRTRNKKKGSNLGTMPENAKQKKESNLGTMPENPNQKKGSNPGTMTENPCNVLILVLYNPK